MLEEKITVEEWWAEMINDLIWSSIEENEHLAWYGQVEAGFPKKEDITGADMEKVMEKLYPIVRDHIGKILGDFDEMGRLSAETKRRT